MALRIEGIAVLRLDIALQSPFLWVETFLDVKNLEIVSNSQQDISGVHLWLVLMKAYRAIELQAEKSISGTGMCFTDFTILEILLHKRPLPVNTLAARIGLTSGSGTTAIDRLEARGLVIRQADPDDRRARVVHLTAAGESLIREAFERHRNDMETVAAALSPEERTTLLGLLRKLGKKDSHDVSETIENGR